jgi:hypothetical protein
MRLKNPITLKIMLVLVISFLGYDGFAQNFPERQMLRKFKADTLALDEINQDGAFKLRGKRSGKWGLYQWLYRGLMTRELIPMKYDSLDFIGFNAPFTRVYQEGKHGVYLSGWSYEDARESVPCIYDDSQIVRQDNQTCLAVQKNGQWLWINWETGQEFLGQTSSDPDHLTDCPKIN